MSDDGRSCPLGHTCSQCHWHIHIFGKDPNTGLDVDKWQCAIAWIPTLLVENSMRQHQTNAAVDKLHTSVTNGNNVLGEAMLKVLSLGNKPPEKALEHEQ